MSFWGRLFGSDEVIKKGTEGLYNGIDKAIYTDEEKVDNFTRMLKLYEPFKIAQRFLALVVGVPFVLIHTVIHVAWLLALWLVVDIERYEFLSTQLGLMADSNLSTLGQPFAIILGFYFFGGAGEGIAKAWKANK